MVDGWMRVLDVREEGGGEEFFVFVEPDEGGWGDVRMANRGGWRKTNHSRLRRMGWTLVEAGVGPYLPLG